MKMRPSKLMFWSHLLWPSQLWYLWWCVVAHWYLCSCHHCHLTSVCWWLLYLNCAPFFLEWVLVKLVEFEDCGFGIFLGQSVGKWLDPKIMYSTLVPSLLLRQPRFALVSFFVCSSVPDCANTTLESGFSGATAGSHFKLATSLYILTRFFGYLSCPFKNDFESSSSNIW